VAGISVFYKGEWKVFSLANVAWISKEKTGGVLVIIKYSGGILNTTDGTMRFGWMKRKRGFHRGMDQI
jgi:hypothetical protein